MDSGVTLWQFLLELLLSDRYQHLISWTSCDGEFKLIDAEAVAKLWGLRKNKTNMNYDKLSRALRYYYDKNIIKKVLGQKFVYRFVSFPDRARLQNKLPMKRKLSSLSGRTVALELRTASGRFGKCAQSNGQRGNSSSRPGSSHNTISAKGLLSQSSISHPYHNPGIRHSDKKMSVLGLEMGVEQGQEHEEHDRIQVRRSRSASASSSSASSSSSSSTDPPLHSQTQTRPFSYLEDGVENGDGGSLGGSGLGLCGVVRDALTSLPGTLDSSRMDRLQFQPWLFPSPSTLSGSGSGSGSGPGAPIPSSMYYLNGNGNSGVAESLSSSNIFLNQEPSHYFNPHFWLALTSRLPNFPITPAEFASLVASSTSSTSSPSPSSHGSPMTFSSALPSKKSPHYLLTSLLIPGSGSSPVSPTGTGSSTVPTSTTTSPNPRNLSPTKISSAQLQNKLQHLQLQLQQQETSLSLQQQQPFPHFHPFSSIHSNGSDSSSSTLDHPHNNSSNQSSLYC